MVIECPKVRDSAALNRRRANLGAALPDLARPARCGASGSRPGRTGSRGRGLRRVAGRGRRGAGNADARLRGYRRPANVAGPAAVNGARSGCRRTTWPRSGRGAPARLGGRGDTAARFGLPTPGLGACGGPGRRRGTAGGRPRAAGGAALEDRSGRARNGALRRSGAGEGGGCLEAGGGRRRRVAVPVLGADDPAGRGQVGGGVSGRVSGHSLRVGSAQSWSGPGLRRRS